MVFTGAGYFMGIHAPGKKGLSNFLAAAHYAVLCQAEGGRIAKSYNSDLKIGTTFSCSHIEAKTNSIKDQQAQVKIDALLNRMFLEPLLGLNYPVKDLKVLRRIEQFVKDGDEKKMGFNMDFIGVQNYTREIVSYDFFTPFVQAKIVKADKRNVHRTVMNWEVYPSSIYYILKEYAAYKDVPEIIVTESGAAFEDTLIDGNIHDEERKLFIQNHIAEILKAKQEGVKVNGYFVWSFTDNFEWAEGYKPRFGLVYIDFETQQRTIKTSGKWYSDFLSG
jgi:beta-glucosidase